MRRQAQFAQRSESFDEHFSDPPKSKTICGEIDPEAAFALKLSGHSWRRVGELLAIEQNRIIRFTGESCSQAVRLWFRRKGRFHAIVRSCGAGRPTGKREETTEWR